MIGQEFVLWNESYEKDAYEDQFGVKHWAYVVHDIVVVKVVESKTTPCTCRKDATGTGYRAVDDEGIEYFNNWDSYDDASMSPSYFWVCHTKKAGFNKAWSGDGTPHLYLGKKAPNTIEEARKARSFT